MSTEGDAINALKVAHSAAIQTQRAAAIADGGLDKTKYYGTGEHNFIEEKIEPSEFKIEFISKNGGTYTVTSY